MPILNISLIKTEITETQYTIYLDGYNNNNLEINVDLKIKNMGIGNMRYIKLKPLHEIKDENEVDLTKNQILAPNDICHNILKLVCQDIEQQNRDIYFLLFYYDHFRNLYYIPIYFTIFKNNNGLTISDTKTGKE